SSHRRAVELVSRSICSPPKSPLARPLEVGLQGRRQPCLEALGVAVAVGFEPTKDPGRTLARFLDRGFPPPIHAPLIRKCRSGDGGGILVLRVRALWRLARLRAVEMGASHRG